MHQNTSDDSNSNTRETTSKPCCKSNHCKRTSEDCTEQQLTTQVVVGKENPNPRYIYIYIYNFLVYINIQCQFIATYNVQVTILKKKDIIREYI